MKNVIDYLIYNKHHEKLEGWALLVMRLIVGVIFVAHGYQKIGLGMDQVAGFFRSTGIIFPLFFAYFITYLELIGGILLILGLFTHLIAKLFVIEMLVAFLMVHVSKGLFVNQGGFEYVAVLFGAAMVIMVFGPGKIAVEDFLQKRKWI